MLAERFLSRTAGAVLAMLLMAGACLAQKPGGGGGGAGAGAGGGSTTGPGGGRTTPTLPNPTIPNPNNQPRQNSPFPDMNRPVFLSGKVQMDDGTPPPESVVIERVCQGYVRPEAHTDSKGHFSFQLGANNAMVADASMSTYDPLNPNGSIPGQNRGVDQRALMGCELRASLPGFRSDVLNLMNRRSMDNPDVGVIVLHRMGDVEGLTISVTSSLAPKDAKKAYDKGREALSKNKPDEAEKQLSKAVELYPKYATAWYELGRAHMAQQKLDVARTDFQHALDADSKFVSPYESLAQMAASENKWQDVADITDRVLRINPWISRSRTTTTRLPTSTCGIWMPPKRVRMS